MSFKISRRNIIANSLAAGASLYAFGNAAFSAVPREEKPEDFFEVIDNKTIDARFIPNNSKSGQVVITNNTNRPVSLRLPSSFVGIPALAQFVMPGNNFGGINNGFGQQGGMGQGMMGGMGQSQVTGGGFGRGGIQNGGGFGGFGGRGGMNRGGMFGPGNMGGAAFSIPPESVRVLRTETVCLEHGKPEPYPNIPYKIERTETFSKDPVLAFILETLARKDVLQKVAQAAAWHVANKLSWNDLANESVKHLIGYSERYFTNEELAKAQELVDYANSIYDTKYKS